MGRRSLLVASAAVLAAISLGLSGCTPNDASAAPDRFTGEWLLVSATDSGGRFPLGMAHVTLTVDATGHATGRGPCNDYAAAVIGDPGAVFVRVLHRGEGLCTDVRLADLDERYIRDLTSTTLGELQTGELELRSPHATMLFRSVRPISTRLLLDRTWTARSEMVSDVTGEYFVVQPAGAVRFGPDHIATITVAQCPTITAQWSTDAGEVLLNDLRRSAADCATPDDGSNRSSILAGLANGFEFSVSGDRLYVTNPRTLTLLQFSPPGAAS